MDTFPHPIVILPPYIINAIKLLDVRPFRWEPILSVNREEFIVCFKEGVQEALEGRMEEGKTIGDTIEKSVMRLREIYLI